MNESKTPGDLLRDLVAQIGKSGPVDDHGHKLVMNNAYIKAVEWLDGKDATARPAKLDGLEAILAGVEAEQRAIPNHPANDPPAGVSRLGQAAIDAGYAEDPRKPAAAVLDERLTEALDWIERAAKGYRNKTLVDCEMAIIRAALPQSPRAAQPVLRELHLAACAWHKHSGEMEHSRYALAFNALREFIAAPPAAQPVAANLDDSFEPTMNINVQPGTVVRFRAGGGYDWEKKSAIEAGLVKNSLYTVKRCDIGHSKTEVLLDEIEGRWNSCLFADASQPDTKDTVYMNIRAERARQDEQWGGPEHDDEHTPWDWSNLIEQQAFWGREQDPWCRFVKIAALAVAAIESIERKKK